MPVFDSSTVVGLARGVKAFLNLQVGLTRGPVPTAADRAARPPQQPTPKIHEREISDLRRELAEARRAVAEAEERAARPQPVLVAADAGLDSDLDPSKMVWIFGTGRTGSTWLAQMMGDLPDHHFWNEPLFGRLFGDLYYSLREEGRSRPSFVLGDPPEARRDSIRSFVMMGTAMRYPAFAEGGYLVLKEPGGSIGAPLLMEALPESRMIFLIRDFRDVMASYMDALKSGGWMYTIRDEQAKAKIENRPDQIDVLQQRAKLVAQGVTRAKEAYEAHRGPKVLVKYEDLRADTLDTMKRIYSALDIPVDEAALARVVEKHSWENVPEEKKGKGKFHRKAASGTWKEDLTPRQARIVEESLAPLIEEFYPS